MGDSLLASLYPRIRGSQEDVATYALGYLLEQSEILKRSFIALTESKLGISLSNEMVFCCQDADSEFGRPDITGYLNGQLSLICEAKFYAGLTSNQPVSYLKLLQKSSGSGLLFICPSQRIVSLWDKLVEISFEAGISGESIGDYCLNYNGVHMSILSWNELLANLSLAATEKDPSMLSDVNQLQGFCDRIERDVFVPFRPEELCSQTAREIDRYYQVIDETYKILMTHKELNPTTRGLRKSPRWQGYSQYINFGDLAVSIDFLRNLWKTSTSTETPFWFRIYDIVDGRWVESERVRRFLSSIDRKLKEDFNGAMYMALIPKPYATLEELSNDLAGQIIQKMDEYRECNNNH